MFFRCPDVPHNASGINAQALSGPPSLESLPYQEVTVLDGYTRPANGSRIDKQGIEFVINTARWQPLATALTVTGAWFRSTYSNSQLLFDPVSMVVDGKAVTLFNLPAAFITPLTISIVPAICSVHNTVARAAP